MTRTLRIAATAAFVAAALISVPAARADNESGFLGDLNIDHATLPGKTPAQMVAAGYATCHHLESGTSVLDEIGAVDRTYGIDQGNNFVSLASTYLCPDWASHQQPKPQSNKHTDGRDCIPGYRWREANPPDHVCVTQQAQGRTAKENASATAPNAPPDVGIVHPRFTISSLPALCVPVLSVREHAVRSRTGVVATLWHTHGG